MDKDPFAGTIEELRRHDRDRFLATLWAPAPVRDGLLALLAFNLDLARLRDTVSQPLLAQIRLQWWRDALAEIAAGEAPRRHPILGVLAPLLAQGRIEAAPLGAMIDARERDWDETPPETLAQLDDYARGTGGALAEARVQLLGAGRQVDIAAARLVGTGWALTGLIRALPFHAAKGRVTIPATVLDEAGIGPEALRQDGPGLRRAVSALAAHARGHLAAARGHRRQVARAAMPVLAETRVAEAYLDRLGKLEYDVFDARLGEPDSLAAWRLGLAKLTGRY